MNAPLQDVLAVWRTQLAHAAAQGGHAPPRILAVTKTRPAADLLAAWTCGVAIGENRVQEAAAKAGELGDRWRRDEAELIGPLQTNKARMAVRLFGRIQTLDRERLGDALQAEMERPGAPAAPLRVLVQVNISREPQKAGVLPEDLPALVRAFGRWPKLCCEGLMAIPAAVQDPEEARPAFRAMFGLFTALQAAGAELPANVNFRELSMGMSHDALVAAGEGATWVRLGTALFGPR